MPIKRFWLFSESVERIQAGNDLREVNIHGSLGSGESTNGLIASLNEKLGTVVVRDYPRDKGSINRLKMTISR